MFWAALIIILGLVLLAGIWFLQRYYAKATLDIAIVRTGFGGRRIMTNGGCLALPILHQLQRVSMGTLTFSIRCD